MDTQLQPSDLDLLRQGSDPDIPTTLTVVAVDGSDASIQALAWALRDARARHVPLEVLTLWPAHRHQLVRDVPGHFCEPRWQARSLQREAIRRALDGFEDPPLVVSRLENAEVTEALVRESRRCDRLVLGAHDPTSESGAHHPRLTEDVVAQARCDVVVVDTTGHASTTSTAPAARTPVASADH